MENREIERLRAENKKLRSWLDRVLKVISERPIDGKTPDPERPSQIFPAGFLMPPITRAKHPNAEQLQEILDQAYLEGLLP